MTTQLTQSLSLLKALVFSMGILAMLSACQPDAQVASFEAIPLKLDQENQLNEQKALNSGTQSLNRYHSVIRELDELSMHYDADRKKLALDLQQKTAGASSLQIPNIDIQYLVPLLPYSHAPQIDAFDKANLLLAEFARNGISMSYHEKNEVLPYFYAGADFFNDEAEFVYTAQGEIMPNKQVRPKRMSVVNNCLDPCLWELNASDAVGEMYHAWVNIPEALYYSMIKDQNGIENEATELSTFINHPPSLEEIPLELDRLRSVGKELLSTEAAIASSKEIGAYSTQDSRRKVQRGFYRMMRDSARFSPKTFGEMEAGDIFDLHSFKAPGIYDQHTRMQVSYNPDWEKVTIRQVEPKTSYGGKHDSYGKFGYIELELKSHDGKNSIIAGNIPVELLVFNEDYKIPAFGAGVLSSSERVERRFLRLQSSSYPYYAYMAKNVGEQQFLLNNHEIGYEQIYLRPFQKDQKTYLRVTVVSYERIVDLLEVEIPLDQDLTNKIIKASEAYKPPVYEVYTDTNII